MKGQKIMALFITNRYGQTSEWYMGDSRPELNHLIDSVEADGDELVCLQSARFRDLPMVLNTKAVKWFGDHAKFIVANL
jgi:hypothetical protein